MTMQNVMTQESGMTMQNGMTIAKHGRRYWRVYDEDGSLVCTAVYRKAAREVVRRLCAARGTDPGLTAEADEKAAAKVKKGEK